MALVRACPECGLESDEIRCPRCNALKLVGCSGECGRCGSECDTRPNVPLETAPSDAAADDPDHMGTPLER